MTCQWFPPRAPEPICSMPVLFPDTESPKPDLGTNKNIRFRQVILFIGDKLHGGCRPGANQRWLAGYARKAGRWIISRIRA